jgi:hypothetical protein
VTASLRRCQRASRLRRMHRPAWSRHRHHPGAQCSPGRVRFLFGERPSRSSPRFLPLFLRSRKCRLLHPPPSLR